MMTRDPKEVWNEETEEEDSDKTVDSAERQERRLSLKVMMQDISEVESRAREVQEAVLSFGSGEFTEKTTTMAQTIPKAERRRSIRNYERVVVGGAVQDVDIVESRAKALQDAAQTFTFESHSDAADNNVAHPHPKSERRRSLRKQEHTPIDDTAQDISAVESRAKAMQNALQKLAPLAPGSYADGDDSTAPTTPSEAHTRTKAERRRSVRKQEPDPVDETKLQDVNVAEWRAQVMQRAVENFDSGTVPTGPVVAHPQPKKERWRSVRIEERAPVGATDALGLGSGGPKRVDVDLNRQECDILIADIHVVD